MEGMGRIEPRMASRVFGGRLYGLGFSVLEILPNFRSRNERQSGMSCARSRPRFALLAALSLTWLLTVQMSPAWQKPLFGLAPSRGFCWRTGCRHSLRSASVLAHRDAPDCVGELRAWALRTAVFSGQRSFGLGKPGGLCVGNHPLLARGASGVARSRVSLSVGRR